MKNETISAKRIGYLILTGIVSLLIPSAINFIAGDDLGNIAVRALLLLLMTVILAIFVEHLRINGSLSGGSGNSLKSYVICFFVLTVISSLFTFLRAYTAPVMIVGIIAVAALETGAGMAVSLYMAALVLLTSVSSIYEGATYLVLILVGCLLGHIASGKKYRVYCAIIAVAVSFAAPVTMSVIDGFALDSLNYILCMTSALAAGICIVIFAPLLGNKKRTQVQGSLSTILSDSYHLRTELRAFSYNAYEHAVNTAIIASHAASAIGADENLAAAGGFYYRIGVLAGDNLVENGIKIAETNCFPEELVDIISEFNGEMKKPSTPESAIVHICDSIVSKYEAMGADTFSSEWNREVIVRDIMNEKSGEGLYDESGLTMNMFIKVRDSIIMEDALG